jgi:hypothetical protein
MNRMRSFLGAGLLAAVLAACATNRPPAMEEAVVTPARLQPGESAFITVKVKDRHRIVDRVVAVVKEDPRVKLPLHDDGTGGDAEAGDGKWTLKVDVPFTAPPGSYTLEIAAYRKDGEVIAVSGAEGDRPLSTTAQVSIHYPQEVVAEEPGPAPDAAVVPAPEAEAAPDDEAEAPSEVEAPPTGQEAAPQQ